MTPEAETILSLIQSVSPDDTAKLDEIDCFVEAFIRGWDICTGTSFKYTRSRDQLKKIRPEGWYMKSSIGHDKWTQLCGDIDTVIYRAPTEELAELHAIIQAIAYERGG